MVQLDVHGVEEVIDLQESPSYMQTNKKKQLEIEKLEYPCIQREMLT